jgi:hypothetical protein
MMSADAVTSDGRSSLADGRVCAAGHDIGAELTAGRR